MKPLTTILRYSGLLPGRRIPRLMSFVPVTHLPLLMCSALLSVVEAMSMYSSKKSDFAFCLRITSWFLKPLSYFYTLYHFCLNYESIINVLRSVNATPSRRYATFLTLQACFTFVVNMITGIVNFGLGYMPVLIAFSLSILWTSWMMIVSCFTVAFTALADRAKDFPNMVGQVRRMLPKQPTPALAAAQIRHLRDVYTNVCDAVQKIGDMYTNLMFVWYIDTIISVFVAIPSMVEANFTPFFVIGVGLTVVMEVTAAVAEATNQKENALFSVHELAAADNGVDPRITRELLETCVTVRISDVRVTVAGFADVNRGFVLTIVSGVVTYLMIVYPT